MIVIVVVMLMFGGRGKISNLMGDFAQGIKAFKKGMADDTADAQGSKSEPVKSIDSGAAKKAETERRAESAHS
jgi:sec-independent protein translocase protein TatA